MEQYTEPARTIPVKAQVDVLVAGSGPAGFAAAIAAARSGAHTMIVEQTGNIGGVATTGLMALWSGRVKSSLYDEILARSKDCDKERIINPERLKAVLQEMLSEAGVEVLLYTTASAPILEDGSFKGLVVESKSGREAIFSKVVVDATGDGDIAARAGVPFFKGRESDGKMQPMTLMFKVAGVDYERAVFPYGFETTFPMPKGDLQSLGREHIPHPAGHVLLYHTSLPGVVTCNMTNAIELDGTKAEDLTKAEYVCRSQIPHIVKFLQDFVPGYEECYHISSASVIGVRETRHFEGETVLTEHDILAAREFDDWAVREAHFNFDVHSLTGAGLDVTGAQKKFSQKKGYDIPYGCLVPKQVDQLLLAGRNISGTHLAHSNFRVMPICVGLGEAAGTAAALCVKHQVTPRALDVKRLQQQLTKQ